MYLLAKQNLINTFIHIIHNVSPECLINENVKLDPINKKVKICQECFNSEVNYHIVGFGKAALKMTISLVQILNHRVKGGVLIVPEAGTAADVLRSHNNCSINIYEASCNNLPDQRSLAATDEVLQFVRNTPEDLVIIVLISGGGSSLLCKPKNGVTLEEKLLTTKLLVAAGANIQELNTVRKVLSTVKGGGLAHLMGNKKTICLILSDVIGDPIDLIASGPTALYSNPAYSAFDVINKYNLKDRIPSNAIALLNKSNLFKKLDDCHITNYIVGSNDIALKAGIEYGGLVNTDKFCLSSRVDGWACDVANSYYKLAQLTMRFLADLDSVTFLADSKEWLQQFTSWRVDESLFSDLVSLRQMNNTNSILYIMGGETTVRLNGTGKGGRNQELSLHFSNLCFLSNQGNQMGNWDTMLLCGGTDGIDGPTDAAGAVGCSAVVSKGNYQGLDVKKYLENNDSYNYLHSVANEEFLIKIGPTGTNVSDVHLLLIYDKSALKSEQ